MTVDAKKLAAALRKNAKVMTADYTAQLWRALADIVEQAAEPEPAPIPDDVRATVREALRVALAWPPPHSDSAELIHKALAALDQEKTSDE